MTHDSHEEIPLVMAEEETSLSPQARTPRLP